MRTDWWRDFFHGLPVAFWHHAVPAAATAAEAAFLLRHLPPGPTLDVPCGDGRLACALARAGRRVVGVDLAPEFLALARVAGAGLEVALHERDMRDLPWPSAFAAAFCFGNSFGYLGDDGDAAFLAAVRAALRPDGVFVLDAATAESVFPVLQPTRRHEAAGYVLESRVGWDALAGLLRSDYVFTHGDERCERTAWLRVRCAREVAAMLRAAGFASIAVHGGLAGEPLEPVPGRRALFVARA